MFSVSERPNGDVIVSLRIPPIKKPRDGVLNTQSARFTIHQSRQSKEINAIQWTFVLTTGEKRRNENYTKAIKNLNGFAPIGCFRIRRPTDFTLTPADGARMVSAGEMDSNVATLFVSLSVSNGDIIFPETSSADYSVRNLGVSGFNITVMSSYAPIQSHSSHDSFLNLTLPPDVGTVTSEDGVLVEELTETHRRMRYKLFDKFGRDLIAIGSSYGASAEFQNGRRFFKSGIPDASWFWWLQSLKQFTSDRGSGP